MPDCAPFLSTERYCRHLARFFFAPGYDREDMLQEARVAAWLAPCGLERVAARRRLIEIVRRSQRGGRPELCPPVDVPDPQDVVDVVAARQRLRSVLATSFTDLEREALGRAVRGEGCVGRLDNALQRARRKLAA